MSGFQGRTRMSYADAVVLVEKPGNTIRHLLDNEDGTYSVMSHIVCEFCDYCAESRGLLTVHKAKADPYHNDDPYHNE